MGQKIFDYSYQTHKLGTESCISNIIPSEILDDYLATRKRNFEINKLYLEYQKQGLFDTLVFQKMIVQNMVLMFKRRKYLKNWAVL